MDDTLDPAGAAELHPAADVRVAEDRAVDDELVGLDRAIDPRVRPTTSVPRQKTSPFSRPSTCARPWYARIPSNTQFSARTTFGALGSGRRSATWDH